MAQELVIVPSGLWTDPNPLSQVPPGALEQLSNCWIQRPGIIEPRPGFPSTEVTAAGAVSETVVHMCTFDGDTFVFTIDASDDGHVYTLTAGNEITRAGTFGTSAWEFTAGQVHTAEIGGNLYVTSGQGVYRITSAAATTAVRAGLPRPPPTSVDLETVGGINYPFAEDSSWAYRICETTTAGALPIRSAPSSRVIERSYTGTAASYVEHTFARTPANVSEFYRSAVAASYDGSPSDEMTLIGTAAASSVEFNDDVSATGLRGGALYTNETQQGALLENGMPPFCRDIALFRDMHFFGSATRAPVLTFEVLAYGPDWRGANQSYSDRLTYYSAAGTITSGSPTITGLSSTDTAKLRVGMRLCDTAGIPNPAIADATWPIDTYITVVGATSITVNNNALANDTAFIAFDWIEVEVVDSAFGTSTERVFVTATTTGNYAVQAAEVILVAGTDVGGPQLMAYALSKLFDGVSNPLLTVSAFGDGLTTPWTFIVEAFAHDVTSVTVRVSNPGATPKRIDRTTGITEGRSGTAATLMLSKPGEPEHVPSGDSYSKVIGAADKAIERIIPTRDSLFVFKEDGIWRVSGYSPDSLQVDEYDRTLRLIHPDAVCQWNGAIVAWTTRGVMLLSESSMERISDPIFTDLDTQATSVTDAGTPVYITPWHERDAIVLTLSARQAYVFCFRTRAWSTWTFPRLATAGIADGDELRIGSKRFANAFATYVMSSDISTHDAAALYTNVHAIVDGTTVAVRASTTQWVPVVGDTLSQGAYSDTVVSTLGLDVVAGQPCWVFTVSDTTGLITGTATGTTGSVGYAVEVTDRTGGNPHLAKVYRDLVLFWDGAGYDTASISFENDRVGLAGTLTLTPSMAREVMRIRVPKDARRCKRMKTQLDLRTQVPDWKLLGFSFLYEPKGTRFPDAA